MNPLKFFKENSLTIVKGTKVGSIIIGFVAALGGIQNAGDNNKALAKDGIILGGAALIAIGADSLEKRFKANTMTFPGDQTFEAIDQTQSPQAKSDTRTLG